MIPYTFYINLDRRTDRRAEFETECSRMGISAERFSAIEQNPGDVGCLRSHIAVLKEARIRGLPEVLIFEDDFQFLVLAEQFHTLMDIARDISYDVIMLGYNLQTSAPFNAVLGKVMDAQTTSGYLVHSRFYDKLLAVMEASIEPLLRTRRHWIYAADQCWKPLQPTHDWYYFLERIGKQRAGYSDLAGQIVDYGC